ncbi:SigB/SigF/SigG family RNA polymerase sigma factor [Clostridium aminobutyricum]|uniref:SigB/SigF/SigG family RNA polymerase sigma factor n=1 Tax=Clostridium aminobutyricum TaxID=33953 RepID=A0A939D8H1_CLOAM|nr:SigB/SigF/SigG family RNA polymerase sigma factor [Clostridium aminobutyricum]MBN7773359.1 SigB/SigF/SigG family RNA polymerase sigma factor [Clostridium aminobutyricum]
MINQEVFLQYRQNRNIAIRNQIVEAYLYMVEILIRRYLNKGVDYDDLYQVGAMALVAAVDRFDPEKGFEFSSFATPTILGEIKRYFRDKEWSMKVPRRTKEISLKLSSAKEELFEKCGRTPTVAELAEHLELTQEEVLEAIESSKAYATYSLNQSIDDSERELVNYEKFASIEEKGYNSVEDFEIIKAVFKNFNEKEKSVFKLRYVENKTQSDIAEQLGVSQMTISRIEKSIRHKFHEELQR